jgi:hypothetical protein
MNQLLLTDVAYKELVKNIPSNLSRYSKGSSQLVDSKSITTNFFKSTVIPKTRLRLTLPTEQSSYDFENAVQVHECFELTPLQASDPRLWATLTHVEAWQYMHRRWPVDDSKKPSFIRSRYFVAGSDSRAIIRNGIARLWWSAEISKNPKFKKDQYRLTQILLSKLDITQQLLERSYGRSRRVVQSILRFIDQYSDQCLNDGQISRDRIRHLAKQLSLRSGLTVLDSMPEACLHDFLLSELKRFDKMRT